MKNVIILGAGRSGTSLSAGALSEAGYFMGDDLLEARSTNPKGFFEDRHINWLNERILFTQMPLWRRMPYVGRLPSAVPGPNHMWLARVPLDAKLNKSKDVLDDIQALVVREPFCFKDPRFSYTLPAWRPYLQNTVFLCVFRDPAVMITSTQKSLATAPYLANLKLTATHLNRTWELIYGHILERHRREGRWLFMHYEQFFDSTALERLSEFAEAPVSGGFAERSLQRSPPADCVSAANRAIYRELCEAASYAPKA
ncbi:MAG TPA: hypothetical protein VJS47_01160 [Rhizomicrobium sp.]|nr:hypothetical protein [Rhizomicrobium sp.]